MSEQLRRLTDAGIRSMQDWLREVKHDPTLPVPNGLLFGSESTVLDNSVGVEPLSASDRYSLGVELEIQLQHLDSTELYDDAGIWCWLTLYNIRLVMPDKVGALARYIPQPEWNRKYRHLLRGPWALISMLKSKGLPVELGKPLLAKPCHTPGELYEQVASRVDQTSSEGILDALGQLFFDQDTQQLRPGAAGKNRGSARRFGKIINQRLLTHHIPLATGPGIIEVLPTNEFILPE